MRALYDRLFVPNVLHFAKMTGISNKTVVKKWGSFRPMWTDETENNIAAMVGQDFIFENRISWRGKLAGQSFETDFAVLTPS